MLITLLQGLVILVIILAVEPLRPLDSETEISRDQDANLRKMVHLLTSAHSTGRRLNPKSLAKARSVYKKITKNKSRSQIKNWLRQDSPAASGGAEASLVEKELKSALAQKKSALYDRPYVEKSGKNDFLVISSDLTDPFVTVIPNAIHYNIEKKCVNWLDDCSLKGIRQRLLRGVRSPFK